jgi:hypothetical protein
MVLIVKGNDPTFSNNVNGITGLNKFNKEDLKKIGAKNLSQFLSTLIGIGLLYHNGATGYTKDKLIENGYSGSGLRKDSVFYWLESARLFNGYSFDLENKSVAFAYASVFMDLEIGNVVILPSQKYFNEYVKYVAYLALP